MIELEKTYNASKVEPGIYQKWLKSGYFNPDNLPDAGHREPFTIALPPPNVTGVLHMGHAFEDTIQDAVIRYQRMRGKKALWVPGTDHAAIATQAKFESEHFKKEKKSRHDYSREEFFALVNQYALANQQDILSQLHKLGLSLDWSRLAFTLDQPRELAVRTAFKKMYEAGLIYRGYRVVNWDVKGQTTVSDDEIEHETTKATLYTFRYSNGFPVPIATTRPETKLGDTAVAVHPEGKWKKYVGREFDVDFIGTPLHIKIIADKEVDPAFGTGALGVTPAHSMADYEMAQRHGLPLKPVINEFAKMTAGGPELTGKKTAEAREIVVEKLRTAGLLEKQEEVTQNLSKAQRTGGIIEPLPKLQWFVDVNKKFKIQDSRLKKIESGEALTLKEVMERVIKSGQIKIMPERFEKIYYHWIENLRDWCISRQIIYGHRIPVWYHPENQKSKIKNQNCPQPIMSIKTIDKCPNCSRPVKQDLDTLDTWFSSALWTFSTLGWPKDTTNLKLYHPTSVMMPGYEILFFWVARMILMSGFLLGDIPFHKVYLHGIVRDSKGRKFSKSLNNGIDPLEITAKYGTDALRMALIFGAAPGNDVIFDEQKVKGMKHFANKLWNIARFIIMNLEAEGYRVEGTETQTSNPTHNAPLPPLNPSTAFRAGLRGGGEPFGSELMVEEEELSDADREILEKTNATVKTVTQFLENYRLHEAAQEIYQFTWHEFADIYIEASKEQLKNEKLKASTLSTLNFTLLTCLKLLHPFMPFVTEEIWKQLGQKELLLISPWPK